MALTRKALKAMGIEDEKIELIISDHAEVVDALKNERDGYKAKADDFDKVSSELTELKSKNNEDWKAKYETEHGEFEKYKSAQSAATERAAKERAFRDILRAAGVSEKRYDAICKVSDLDGLKLTEDGKIENEAEHLENVKRDWSDFIVTSESRGANVPNPPANTGTTKLTRDEILKITDSIARQKAIAENITLFEGD